MTRRTGRRSRAGLAVVPLLVVGLGACGTSDARDTRRPAAAGPSQSAVTPSGSPAVALRKAPPPWPPELTAGTKFVDAAGLTAFGQEHTQVHYHAHLDINVNGKPVPVAPDIGFASDDGKRATGLSPLHTHDASGVLHVEAPKAEVFTLGQLFTEWNVFLSRDCIGSLCAGNGKVLRVFVNGTPYAGNPTGIVLKAHQEIAIQYGDPARLPAPPKSYDFGEL